MVSVLLNTDYTAVSLKMIMVTEINGKLFLEPIKSKSMPTLMYGAACLSIYFGKKLIKNKESEKSSMTAQMDDTTIDNLEW